MQAGVEVFFYNQPFGPGYFDNVTLLIPNVISAAIIVNPYQTVRNWYPYDVELIWGGYSGGAQTTFSQMDSYFSLYFLNDFGNLQLFPSFYTFGSQTAEYANFLKVVPTSTGGRVVVGTNYNGFLDNA